MESKRIVDVLGKFVSESRLAKMQRVVEARTAGVGVALENLNDVHNVSAILRTVDSFGVHSVNSIEAFGGPSGFNKDVSKGSEKFLDFQRFASTAEWLERRATLGGSIVTTELGAPDVSLVDWLRLPRPIFVVMGNEIRGVSKLVRSAATATCSLPACGMAQSYNVSVATAILLTILKEKGVLEGHPLSEETRNDVLAKWLIEDVVASHVILKRHNLVPPEL